MKIKLKIFFLFLPMSANNIFAQDLCQLEEKNQEIKVEFLDFTPEFFTKPIMPQDSSDQRNEATIIINGHGNMLFDFKTGKAKPVIGNYDAVPSVDGRIITVPGQDETSQQFLIFDRNKLGTPIYIDNDLKGSYQSVGIVSTGANKKVYRVITDTVTASFGAGLTGVSFRFNLSDPNEGSFNLSTRTSTSPGLRLGGTQTSDAPPAKKEEEYNAKNLQYRDYEVTTAGNDLIVTALKEVTPLCPNLKINLKLPMLSKDGKLLSIYNYETGTTQILKITKQFNKPNNCELVKDLGFASTKVEFNADSSKITFATDAMATAAKEVIWNNVPDAKKRNMNVYVYDFKKNELSRISNNHSGNAYYPAFSRDNTITYLNQENSPGKQSYSLVQAKIPEKASMKLPEKEFFKLTTCAYPENKLALIALGKLWFQVCSKLDAVPSSFGSYSQALALDPKQCEALVTKYWEDTKNGFGESYLLARDEGSKDRSVNQNIENRFLELRSLSVTDLLNVCPKEKTLAAKPIRKILNIKTPKKEKDPLMQNCAQCHNVGGPRPFVAGDNESVKKYKGQAIQHIKDDFMPMGAKLNPDEKNRLIKYLEGFR